MTYSDDFLAWLKKDECRLYMSPLDAQYAAWQTAERDALERAAQYFEDSGDPEGANMIRRLQDAQSGEEKQ